jgi:hypothetical protein
LFTIFTAECSLFQTYLGAEGVAQLVGTCLACVKSWVQSPKPQKQNLARSGGVHPYNPSHLGDRQEDHEFKASMIKLARYYLKNKMQNKMSRGVVQGKGALCLVCPRPEVQSPVPQL